MTVPERCLTFTLIVLLLIVLLSGVSLDKANAQLNSFRVNGIIEGNSAVWHSVFEVKQNDLVLISISSSSVFNSELLFPNLTVCKSIDFSSSHTYEFNAEVQGTYLLMLSSWTGLKANYSISSSHEIGNANLMTPFRVSGVIESYASVWCHLYNVKQNQIVLISISGTAVFNSEFQYPNKTVYKTIDFSSQHIYMFHAEVSGTYLLMLSSWTGLKANYSISSSHAFNNNTEKANIGTSIPFSVPDYIPDGDSFIYYFGDNANVTTKDRTATHAYNEAGNFTVVIMIKSNSGESIVQTFNVVVESGNSEPPWALIGIIVSIVGIVIATMFAVLTEKRERKKDKTKKKKRQPLIAV